MCWTPLCAKKTDNVNKTRTTGGKTEPNIVFIRTLQRTSQRRAPEGLNVSTSYKTPVVLLIYTVQSGKSIGTHRGKKHLRKKYKIYCHLRYGYFITVNRIVITTLEFFKR